MLENGQTPLVITTQKMELVIEKEEHLTSQDPIVLDNITYDIISKNIINVTNYDIRNRKFKPSNSFFITRNKSYCLGVLTANTPGDTRKDQIAYVRNMLKLLSNKNSNLVQFKFWNGNSWITIGFDHKKDLIFCKERLNSEKQDLIKFI